MQLGRGVTLGFPADTITGRRFLRKVDMGGPVPDQDLAYGPCMVWLGAVTDQGYGLFRVGPDEVLGAHVWSFMAVYGPVPPGYEVGHLCHPDTCLDGVSCRHRACVAPMHVRAMTHEENTRTGNSPAGVNARKTHCDANHELSGANLYRHPKRGTRHCRTCQARRAAEADAAAAKVKQLSAFMRQPRGDAQLDGGRMDAQG